MIRYVGCIVKVLPCGKNPDIQMHSCCLSSSHSGSHLWTQTLNKPGVLLFLPIITYLFLQENLVPLATQVDPGPRPPHDRQEVRQCQCQARRGRRDDLWSRESLGILSLRLSCSPRHPAKESKGKKRGKAEKGCQGDKRC